MGSEGLLGLEPTWEKLKDQHVVAEDALSASVPSTSSAQVTALDLDQMVANIKEDAYELSHSIERLMEANIQISSLATETEHAKKPGAIINLRTSMMHPVPCVPFILQTRTSCGWLWNASHVVILTCLLAPRTAMIVCRMSTWQSCSHRHEHWL